MYHESMVYLNKIFTDLATRSCPLLTEFTADAETFTQQLSFFDADCENGCQDGCNGCNCGCGCGCNGGLDFSGDLTFVPENTQVFISAFNLVEPEGLTADDVTVNGISVDGLEFFNDRFMASTNALMAQIADCKCMEKGLPTRGFLLIQTTGGWLARLTVVVTGSVFGCGGGKQFRLVMTSREDSPVVVPGSNTFAATSICLPCTVGGISPIINFSFSAAATLLNPVITPTTDADSCNVTLTGSLVTEPIANVQVTRQTLFTTTASIVEQTCDGVPQPCSQIPITRCCYDNANEVEGIEPREAEAKDGCDCGCDEQNDRSVKKRNPQISCQWNGCNGCGF